MVGRLGMKERTRGKRGIRDRMKKKKMEKRKKTRKKSPGITSPSYGRFRNGFKNAIPECPTAYHFRTP